VSTGDLIVLRDDTGSLGVGFVKRVLECPGRKTRHRCPTCGTSQLERRRTLTPRFRCTRGHAFEASVDSDEDVVVYRAEYERSYLESRALSPNALESLCLARSRQNAIRELDLDRTMAELRQRGLWPAFTSDA
jgi:hypothetical protein